MLPMKKLRQRELELLGQGFTAAAKPRPNLNPDRCILNSILPILCVTGHVEFLVETRSPEGWEEGKGGAVQMRISNLESLFIDKKCPKL